MPELEHTEIDNRPQLPDVIPQGEVTVRGERHVYKTFESEDNGPKQQTEYVLNKAPINSIESIVGTDKSDNSRTFTKGADYTIDDLVKDRSESFTFFVTEDTYELTDPPDNPDSLVLTDESGDTYDEGDEFDLTNPDGKARDTIVWKENEPNPDNEEQFETSYEVTFPDSVVRWLEDTADALPENGTSFYVTYRAPSIISRYLDSSEESLNNVNNDLVNIIEGKFIDTATDEELDQLGRLFGPLIGKRRGRSDEQYRIYLKSVVQSFVSRGTVNGIKLAVSAATDVPIDDIEIREDFSDNSYEVVVIPNTPVTGSLLEEVAEIADPSGVKIDLTRFSVPDEEVEVNDTTDITEGQQIFDDMTVDDATANFGFGVEGAVFENVLSDDAVAIDPNKNTVSDQMTADDVVAIDPNTFTISDDVTIQETIDSTENKVSWDEANWDSFNWATENN